MRPLALLSALVACATSSAASWALQVTSADELGKKTLNAITVDFHELKGKDKQVFGSPEIGQPYSTLGLVLPSQMIHAPADMKDGDHVTIESTGISRVNNASYQSLAFTRPQKIVGFTVQSPKATSVVITALDKNGRTLDETILVDAREAKYVGFVLKSAEITVVRIVAPHASAMDAESDPTTVTGVTFSVTGEGDAAETAADGLGMGGDYGQARAVDAPGIGAGALAYAGAGGDAGVGGSGNGGNNNFGRNPGNRNPNLPPTTIPEPAEVSLLSAGVVAALRRRPRA